MLGVTVPIYLHTAHSLPSGHPSGPKHSINQPKKTLSWEAGHHINLTTVTPALGDGAGRDSA